MTESAKTWVRFAAVSAVWIGTVVYFDNKLEDLDDRFNEMTVEHLDAQARVEALDHTLDAITAAIEETRQTASDAQDCACSAADELGVGPFGRTQPQRRR